MFIDPNHYRAPRSLRVLPPRYFQGIKKCRFVDYGEAAAYLDES